MSLKGLSSFQFFSLEGFLADKRMVFVKATPWNDGEGNDIKLEGSKVVVQIAEDKTKYTKEDIDNFGEQFTVKVRGVSPKSYAKLSPLTTEVVISEVERVTLWGEFRNELSIIAVVNVKN